MDDAHDSLHDSDSEPDDTQAGDAPGGEDVSLEQLSEAFAAMLRTDGGAAGAADGRADDHAAVDEADDSTDVPLGSGQGDEAATDTCQVTPRSILEAILFVGSPENEPITSRQVSALIRGVEPDEVDQLVAELNAIYASDGCPFHIASHGAGYGLVLRDEFQRIRDKFYGRIREARLSQAAIETLAVVAYNQPATRDQVHELRGTTSGAILTQLVRRGLLRIERPADRPRDPHYFTTDRFLKVFGLDSLDDLPRSEDLDSKL